MMTPHNKPSKLLLRFFRWFCHPDYVEDIEGDLLERFEQRPFRWLFAWEILKLIRPELIKKTGGSVTLNFYGMFKHNLLITFRNFFRHKTIFGINLTGLAASLTCILFSGLWIQDEVMKDRFHQDPDHLFQVYSRFDYESGVQVWKGVSGLIDPAIEAQIPQVSHSTVFTDVHEYVLSSKEKQFKVDGRFADGDYLKVFNYPLISGKSDALGDPSGIFISQSLAKRFFSTPEVIGQSLTFHFFDYEKTFQVAGIFEDVTAASSESFEFILPWAYYHDELINFKSWGNFYGRVVVRIDDLSQRKFVEEKIDQIFQNNQSSEVAALFLVNYSDQYLHGNYEDGKPAGGRIDYVYLTIIVTLFILIIACINFINLSTAFASLKAKEIGVKKTFGATKGALAYQFFLESVLLTLMAILIAMSTVALLLDSFNYLTAKRLTLDPVFLVGALFFVPVIGLIAGSYPALYLSGLEVIAALKMKIYRHSFSGEWGRKTLVLLQFTLSIILIVGTLIVGAQMDYALTKNLGFDRDNLMYFLKEGTIAKNSQTFVSELVHMPGVKQVSQTGFSVIPGYQNRTAGISWEGKGENEEISIWENYGDAHSTEILGLEMVAGRSFSDDFKTEENSIIFNETAIAAMGIEDPIGKMVEHYTGRKKIIGVARDFHTQSLHMPIEPAMFLCRPGDAHYILVKIEKGQERETIARIENLYQQYNPNYPFDPQFVDQDYQALYESEIRVASLSKLFSLLAILISCMGLFGLTIFQVQRRVKEIGIRKILGCKSWRLAWSMTFDFTKAVFLAILIAVPVSYFIGKQWLENFADSISLQWWMFALASVFALLIAAITVGTQTIRAANENPVKVLRDE